MKTQTIIFALILNVSTYAQITLDFEVPSAPMVPVKISNNVVKFLNCTLDTIFVKGSFRLLNSDGSVYKELFLPPNPQYATAIAEIDYVTATLFDTDSTTLEYLITFMCDSVSGGNHYTYCHTLIANENGVALLDEKYASTYTFSSYSFQPIVQVGNQSKLVLWYSYISPTEHFLRSKIFNLPGQLPSGTDESKSISGNGMTIFPNPNAGNFFVLSKSFENNVNTLDLYSLNGKLIDTYRSASNPVKISDPNLSNGIYLITPRGTVSKIGRVVIQK